MTGTNARQRQLGRSHGRPAADMRRLVLAIGAVVFLDTLFYTVAAPLLPELSHHLHLSKAGAGVLTGAYAAGSLLMAVPGGLMAARWGPRFAVCSGVSLMVVSTLGFGWLNTAVGLDIARFVEGVGGAWAWAGGIAWVVAESPAARRGEMIGKVMAAAVGGALFGPVVGALAAAVGRPAAFTGVAVLGMLIMLATSRVPQTGEASGEGLGMMVAALRRPIFRMAMWMMLVPAVISGMFTLLGPLRLSQFGAGATVIGIVYVLSAAAEALIAPSVGRMSDRHGRVRSIRVSLCVMTILLVIFTLPHTVLLVAMMIILSMVTLGSFWAPTMALVSDVAQANGIETALAAALTDLGWAGGQLIGAVLGGAAANAMGDAIPMVCAAALALITLLLLLRRDIAGPLHSAQQSASEH